MELTEFQSKQQQELRKVQLIQLEILKQIKQICERHNIVYVLASGTLLGAIRHTGFIPWDDDADIGMTRTNYSRFIEAAKKELPEQYYCLDWHSSPTYGFPYAKVKKRNTVYVEETDANSINNEIFVDIFPYDAYPQKRFGSITQGMPMIVLRTLLKLKCHNVPWAASTSFGKHLKYIPFVLLSKILSRNLLIKAYERLATKYNCSEYDLLFAHGISRYGRWVVNRTWIEKTEYHEFEDTLFLVPKSFDRVLRMAYGDYMVLPPVGSRWNRHHVIRVETRDSNN